MKLAIIWLLRLATLAAPAYSLYIFANGEGADKDIDWWKAQAGFIAWALGSYLTILISTYAFNINMKQVGILAIGVVGLAYFYLTPDVYEAFLSIPFFEANKKMLPIIPYLYTAVICLIAGLFHTRHSKHRKQG
jgi:hypothetical protein